MDQELLSEVRGAIERAAQAEGISVAELYAQLQDVLNEAFRGDGDDKTERVRHFINPKAHIPTTEEVCYAYCELIIEGRKKQQCHQTT